MIEVVSQFTPAFEEEIIFPFVVTAKIVNGSIALILEIELNWIRINF